MDPDQQQAFKQAVERKKQESAEASRQGGHPTRAPQELGPDGAHDLDRPSKSQDEPMPNQKGTRHGQVTAENWNQ
jgi:hypothetical protein